MRVGDYLFERDCRTPNSESYSIIEDDQPVGRVDIHYTSTIVHGTLCVVESFTQESIRELIEVIDEELVDVAGVNREELIIHVFQGRDVGVYSDHGFEQNGNGREGLR